MTQSDDTGTGSNNESQPNAGRRRPGFLGSENSFRRDVITLLGLVVAASGLFLSLYVLIQDSQANNFAMTAEAQMKTPDIQIVSRIGDSVGFDSAEDRGILAANGLSAFFASTECAAGLFDKDPTGEQFDYLYLTIRNLGPGTARNAGFSAFDVLSDNPRADSGCWRPQAQLPFLQPDQFYAVLLAPIPESGRISGIDELPFAEIRFTVEFDDDLGQHHIQAGSLAAADIIEGRIVPEAVSPDYFDPR